MIQALYFFDSHGLPLVYEKTGSRILGCKMDRFISVFAELVKNGLEDNRVGQADVQRFQVLYRTDNEISLFIVADRIDNSKNLSATLETVWSESVPLAKQKQLDACRLKTLDIVLDQTIKIAIFGQPAVGKTTLVSYLLKDLIPIVYRPTIGVEIRLVHEGIFGRNRGVVFWDIGGQQHFSSLWPQFLRNSQLVLVATDSGLRSTLWSRRMIPSLQSWTPDASLLGVANKQDLPQALTAERVGSILKIPTEGLVALDAFDRDQRRRLVKRIVEILGLDSDETS